MDGKRISHFRILEKIDLKKIFKNVGVGLVTGPGKDIGIAYLAEIISYPVATVFRSRTQWVSVYDQTQPTIEPVPPQGPDDLDPLNPVLEASDIGGARMGRYLDDLAATLNATDNCAGSVTLINDIPSYIPMETPTVA